MPAHSGSIYIYSSDVAGGRPIGLTKNQQSEMSGEVPGEGLKTWVFPLSQEMAHNPPNHFKGHPLNPHDLFSI